MGRPSCRLGDTRIGAPHLPRPFPPPPPPPPRRNKCRNEIPSVNVSQVNAYRFASDNGITMCFNDPAGKRQCPFGVHKPWKKASKEALAELQAVCPDLELIQTQQFEDLDACPAAHNAGYT